MGYMTKQSRGTASSICLKCRRSIKTDCGSCPECGNQLKYAGKGFKAPRREAKLQWRKIALLLGNGYSFPTCREYRRGEPIKTLADAKRFVKTHGRNGS